MAKIRHQNAPRRLQDAHKTAQEALRPPPGRPPRRPKMPPRRPQNAPRRPHKTTPRRPKTSPRQPKSHKSTQNQNLIDFLSDPGRYPIGRSDGVPPLPSTFSVQLASSNLLSKKVNIWKMIKTLQRNTSKSSSILGPGADVAVGT